MQEGGVPWAVTGPTAWSVRGFLVWGQSGWNHSSSLCFAFSGPYTNGWHQAVSSESSSQPPSPHCFSQACEHRLPGIIFQRRATPALWGGTWPSARERTWPVWPIWLYPDWFTEIYNTDQPKTEQRRQNNWIVSVSQSSVSEAYRVHQPRLLEQEVPSGGQWGDPVLGDHCFHHTWLLLPSQDRGPNKEQILMNE